MIVIIKKSRGGRGGEAPPPPPPTHTPPFGIDRVGEWWWRKGWVGVGELGVCWGGTTTDDG